MIDSTKLILSVSIEVPLRGVMPRKIRHLKADLSKAGFVLKPQRGKGSYSVWVHPETMITATVSGADGKDAKPYQEQDVREAIARATQARED